MFESSKTGRVRRWAIAGCLAASLSVIAPAMTLASDDDSALTHDARLDGYPQNMVLDASGTATTYIVMCLLGGLGIGVMFIKGKRTHLD
jgi:hypothetical protein